MTRTEELLRDALVAEAERFDPSPDLWRRVTEARVPRRRRIVGPALAVAASAAVVMAFIAYRLEHPRVNVTVPWEPITGATAPSTVTCPDIGFTPNTEDMASGIRATGTDCIEASALIRRAKAEHNFYSGPRAFELDGWRCTVVTDETELPVGHYSCVSGPKVVTWEKT